MNTTNSMSELSAQSRAIAYHQLQEDFGRPSARDIRTLLWDTLEILAVSDALLSPTKRVPCGLDSQDSGFSVHNILGQHSVVWIGKADAETLYGWLGKARRLVGGSGPPMSCADRIHPGLESCLQWFRDEGWDLSRYVHLLASPSATSVQIGEIDSEDFETPTLRERWHALASAWDDFLKYLGKTLSLRMDALAAECGHYARMEDLAESNGIRFLSNGQAVWGRS